MISRTERNAPVNNAPLNEAPGMAPEAAPANVLPAPDYVSSDPTTMIAKLFVKSAQEKRASEELSAQAEEKAEDAADAGRIEAMKDKADKNLMAGLIGGGSQCLQGLAAMQGGAVGLEGVESHASATAAEVSKQWEGSGTLVGGLGKIGEAAAKSEADSADRDVARAESDAKIHKPPPTPSTKKPTPPPRTKARSCSSSRRSSRPKPSASAPPSSRWREPLPTGSICSQRWDQSEPIPTTRAAPDVSNAARYTPC